MYRDGRIKSIRTVISVLCRDASFLFAISYPMLIEISCLCTFFILASHLLLQNFYYTCLVIEAIKQACTHSKQNGVPHYKSSNLKVPKMSCSKSKRYDESMPSLIVCNDVL